jgi:hypothetical protein
MKILCDIRKTIQRLDASEIQLFYGEIHVALSSRLFYL